MIQKKHQRSLRWFNKVLLLFKPGKSLVARSQTKQRQIFWTQLRIVTEDTVNL